MRPKGLTRHTRGEQQSASSPRARRSPHKPAINPWVIALTVTLATFMELLDTLFYYTQLEHQTKLLAFMDCFRVIGWLTLAVVPLVLLIRHFKVGGRAPAGH